MIRKEEKMMRKLWLVIRVWMKRMVKELIAIQRDKSLADMVARNRSKALCMS